MVDIPNNQSPSDLEVIDFQYQHVGRPHVWDGKLVVLTSEYLWLLHLDDDPQAYGEVWEDFNDSAAAIEYLDTTRGETVDGKFVQLLSPDPDSDGFHMLVTDGLIQQLTPMQVFRLWEAVSNEEVVLAPDVDRPALREKLWGLLVQVRQEYFESQLGAALAPYNGDTMWEWEADLAVTSIWTTWVERDIAPVSLHMDINMLAPLSNMYRVVIDKADSTSMENLVRYLPNVPVWIMNEDISTAGLRKLEKMAADAMEEYPAGLTVPLDPDTL